MARFEKSSPKSAKPHAAVARPGRSRTPKGGAIEDTMFFPRLRRHAKWMFVFLALVFALGFVVFGVGAGGTGVGDIFKGNGGGSGVPSVEKAQKAALANPSSAKAWRDLATAAQSAGDTTTAIDALDHYTVLKPKDTDALRELSSLYITQATEKQTASQTAQAQAAYAAAGVSFPGNLVDKSGAYVITDPLGTAINANASSTVTEASTAVQTALSNAISTYKKIVALLPKDPNVQLELAQTAESAGDAATAIAAYEKFIALAPDDPNVSVVRQQIAQLKKASSQTSSGSGG